MLEESKENTSNVVQREDEQMERAILQSLNDEFLRQAKIDSERSAPEHLSGEEMIKRGFTIRIRGNG
ncbi:MAG: hypothetical protein LBI61_00620 [Puniceicoccales bacterium]|jgi:hypothetical protein|nr:hypothetical protein [Puniceicoccales bacterium]